MFMKDREGSWVFGLRGDTSGGPPWVRLSATHVFGVWFVLQTICEGCDSLPVTDLKSFYVKKIYFFLFCIRSSRVFAFLG